MATAYLAGLDGMELYRTRDPIDRAVLTALPEEILRQRLEFDKVRARVWIGQLGAAFKKKGKG